MKVTKKDLIGDIDGFPLEVVQKMVERQVEQGNSADVTVFQRFRLSGCPLNGFNWDETPEKYGFWDAVVLGCNFDLFFEKYPKSTYPKVMEVSDYSDFPRNDSFQRVVFMEKNGMYLAWFQAETLEEVKQEVSTYAWNYARDIEEPVIEVTLEEVAKKFNVETKNLRIKK